MLPGNGQPQGPWSIQIEFITYSQWESGQATLLEKNVSGKIAKKTTKLPSYIISLRLALSLVFEPGVNVITEF